MGSAYKDLSDRSLEELPMLDLTEDLSQEPLEQETPLRPRRGRRRVRRGYAGDVDSGWSWVVLFCAFVMFMLGNGAQFAFGIMYSSIRRSFKTSKATTSWILLLQRGTGSGLGKTIFVNKRM